MFWNKKDKEPTPQKTQSEIIREQALQNMRNAKTEIGEETMDKIREIMAAKEKSIVEQMRRKIDAMDKDKVASAIRDMARDEE
jgi:hypothetical protein